GRVHARTDARLDQVHLDRLRRYVRRRVAGQVGGLDADVELQRQSLGHLPHVLAVVGQVLGDGRPGGAVRPRGVTQADLDRARPGRGVRVAGPVVDPQPPGLAVPAHDDVADADPWRRRIDVHDDLRRVGVGGLFVALADAADGDEGEA